VLVNIQKIRKVSAGTDGGSQVREWKMLHNKKNQFYISCSIVKVTCQGAVKA
jgi:hypothetical protein